MAPIIHSLGESLAALEEALTEFAERQEQGGKLLRLVPRGGSDAG